MEILAAIRALTAAAFILAIPILAAAQSVPKDLAVKLTIKGCASTSVIDTSAGTYIRTGVDGKRWIVPARLTSGEKRWLDTLIADSGVLNFPPKMPVAPSQLSEPGPTEYALDVRRSGQQRTFTFFELPTVGIVEPPGYPLYARLVMLANDIERIFTAMSGVKKLPPAGYCL